ncbi:MAG: acyl-CoA dehydrogenase family protein [Bryobacteraceae bacterium]
MQFSLTSNQHQWRDQVRQFLAAELPPEREMGRASEEDAEGWEFARAFNRALGKRGWLTAAWPREYGGLALSFTDQAIYMEEMTYHRAPLTPSQMAIRMAGSTIIVHGTDEQKRQHLPCIASGDRVFCQGFSEPNAGSDLASLQTRAIADGDDFIVNGSKIWTSHAHNADWMMLLARTDPTAPKHRGITFFLLEMDTPGITVQPLINMGGLHAFNQVFFDNVRVKRENIVGELDRGWYVATTTLDFERSGIHRAAEAHRTLDEVLSFLRTTAGAETSARRAVLRHVAAERAVEVQIGRLMAYRVATLQDARQIPNHEASVSKLYGSELIQRVSRFGVDAFGLAGHLRQGSAPAISDGRFASNYLLSISATIAGGASEVQRGIIATRGLGLPR